jgi:hypothetical protein
MENHVRVFKTSFSKLIMTNYSQDDALAEIMALNRENNCQKRKDIESSIIIRRSDLLFCIYVF